MKKKFLTLLLFLNVVVLVQAQPVPTAIQPVDNATNVSLNANLVIQFNEAVQAGPRSIRIIETGVGEFEVIPSSDPRVSIVGNTVTVNPTGTLDNNTSYHIVIDSGAIQNLAGQSFGGVGATNPDDWNFTTTVGDITPPIPTSIQPVDNAINVGLNANLVIQFNEAVQAGVGNITIVETGIGDFEVIPISDPRVNIAVNAVTINPTGTFDNNASYHVVIDNGAIQDLSGNSFTGVGSTNPDDWNFTTTVGDIIPPAPTSIQPMDNATNVSLNANLVIQFNEAVQAGAGNITIVETGIGNFEVIPISDPRVNIAVNTVTINPTGTFDNANYYVVIDNGAIQDLSGNSFAGVGATNPDDWNFTTSADITAPVPTSIQPMDNATNVSLNANLVIQFNEAVQAGVGNVTIVETGIGNFEVIPISDPRVSIAVNTVTVNPTGTLDNNTSYYVVVDNGAIQDLSGNAFAGAGTINPADWNFTTTATDVIPPVVNTLSPADNAVGVSVVDNLVMVFNENVQKGMGNITIVQSGAGVLEVIPVGDARVTVGGAFVTINPTANLSSNTQYHVLIENGVIRDMASNSFTGFLLSTNWNFTTIGNNLSVDNTGNPLPSNLNQGATNQPIYGFELTAINGPSDFDEVVINRNLGAGAQVGNFSNYRLFYDNDNNGFDIGDNLLGVVGDGSTLTFGSLGQTIGLASPRRYVVIADVAANVPPGGTISLQIVSNGEITTTASGITSVGPYPGSPAIHTVQDAAAPNVVSLTPLDGSTNVAANANLVIQFNEAVKAGGRNITIVETGVGDFEVISTSDPRVSIVGSTVTINPSGILVANTAYHVLIADAAIQDIANNAFAGINNATTWNFTTLPAVNTAPTIEGVGIADLVVEENVPATIINLSPAFQDAETTDANLVYSVTATDFVDGDTEIFSNVTVDNAVDTLTLNYLPNSNGVYNVTVRATDAGGLFVEDTFQVTLLVGVDPAVDTNSITSLIVTPTNGFAFVGKTLQMTATGVSTNGTTNITLASGWSSGATNVAVVDNAGVVTGVAPGDTLISAVFNNVTNSVTVKVRKELLITFSKVKPAKLTTRLKVGKGFAVKGKFTLATTNTLTKADIISKPLKIQVAFLASVTNGPIMGTTALQEANKIKGFKARPKNFGKFIAKPVGSTLPAGNANVLLQATLGPEGINQEVSQLFTNPAPFQVRKVITKEIKK